MPRDGAGDAERNRMLVAIQTEGFQNLVLGSSVALDEVLKKAPSNWYLEAQEAKNLGLVEAVV
jgi:hypothetical protein